MAGFLIIYLKKRIFAPYAILHYIGSRVATAYGSWLSAYGSRVAPENDSRVAEYGSRAVMDTVVENRTVGIL